MSRGSSAVLPRRCEQVALGACARGAHTSIRDHAFVALVISEVEHQADYQVRSGLSKSLIGDLLLNQADSTEGPSRLHD
jgi:hypothetical protein